MLSFDLNNHHDVLVECIDLLSNSVYTNVTTKIQTEIDKLFTIKKYIGLIAPSEETMRLVDENVIIDPDQPSVAEPTNEKKLEQVTFEIAQLEKLKARIQAEIDASTQENPE